MSAPLASDPAAVWVAVSQHLKTSLSASTFSAWFGQARPVALDGGRLEIVVPNEFTRSWITGHFSDLLLAASHASLHDVTEVTVGVDGVSAETPGSETADDPDIAPATPTRVRGGAPPSVGLPRQRLIPTYTFDHFVIGSSNRFAHAASLAVAESPGQSYNPLVIYGNTGLGKTHLLQAIVHSLSEQHPHLSVRYVTSEAFLNEFIADLQAKRVDQFQSRYRTYDVLVVDDIQFLAGKERTQEEFFHTFNSIYQSGGQVILASDRPPREIAHLEERLRSRFEWGLITDIQPPDLETRIAILRTKLRRDRLPEAPPEMLIAIARRVQTNIRELEGALTRTLAYASLNATPLSEELVNSVLRDQYPLDARPVTAEEIQRVVAEAFGLTLADLRSDRRTQPIVYPRQIAMYLCRELTDLSLPRIGEKFGGRDHTTVHYAQAKITRLLREDRGVYTLVQDLTARLRRS